jgi:hypothetical protein
MLRSIVSELVINFKEATKKFIPIKHFSIFRLHWTIKYPSVAPNFLKWQNNIIDDSGLSYCTVHRVPSEVSCRIFYMNIYTWLTINKVSENWWIIYFKFFRHLTYLSLTLSSLCKSYIFILVKTSEILYIYLGAYLLKIILLEFFTHKGW